MGRHHAHQRGHALSAEYGRRRHRFRGLCLRAGTDHRRGSPGLRHSRRLRPDAGCEQQSRQHHRQHPRLRGEAGTGWPAGSGVYPRPAGARHLRHHQAFSRAWRHQRGFPPRPAGDHRIASAGAQRGTPALPSRDRRRRQDGDGLTPDLQRLPPDGRPPRHPRSLLHPGGAEKGDGLPGHGGDRCDGYGRGGEKLLVRGSGGDGHKCRHRHGAGAAGFRGDPPLRGAGGEGGPHRPKPARRRPAQGAGNQISLRPDRNPQDRLRRD